MIEVAQAAVTIIPTMQGAQQQITKDLTSSADTAADSAGKSSGKKFASTFSNSLKSGAKKIAAAVAVSVAGVTALSKTFYNAAKATAEYGDHIDKMSQKMGISTDAYQEWDFIAQHCGTSMDSLKTSMVKLDTAAANGSEAFQKLGISAEEARNMSREELWNKTIKGLTGIEDQTERARIAQELFGKGATEMGALLNMSSDDIDAMRQQAHDLGIVLNEEDIKAAAAFQDSLQNMTQSFQGLKNQLMSEFLPGITTVMDGLTMIFSGDAEGGVAKIKEGVASISAKITEVLPDLVSTGSEIVTAILGAITDNLPLLMPLAADILSTLAGAIVTALPTLLDTGLQILTQLVDGIIANGPTLMQQAAVVITNFATSLAERLPELLTTAASFVTTLVTGIIEHAPEMITGAVQAITSFTTGIIDHLPDVLSKGGEIVGALLAGITTNLPTLLESVGSSMGDIVTAISDAIAKILVALEPYAPQIAAIVDTTITRLPEIVTAFTGLVDTVSGAITSIIEAIAPYIPDITKMVETTVTKIPEIVSAFSDLLAQAGPVIESFGSLIESIGTAIGTVVTAVGECVGKINESFAKVLDSLKGVIDSIGEGAVKAGEGFGMLADAIIKLVNQTGFFDLASTLTAVATAVGSIADTGRRAGDAYTNLEKLMETLTKMAQTDFSSMSADLQTIADKLYVVTLYTPTLKDTKTNLDAIGHVSLSGLASELDKITTKLGDLDSTVTSKMQNMTATITKETGSWAGKVREAVNAVKNIFSGGFKWGIPELKIPVKTPKFSVQGRWEYDSNGNVTRVPKINVEWYRRAAQMGALFDRPTIIGVGDAAQPEMLIGEDTLFGMLKQVVGDGAGFNQTNNFNVAQGFDPIEAARLIRNNTRQVLTRMRGGV